MKRLTVFHDGAIWGEYDKWDDLRKLPAGAYICDHGFAARQPQRWYFEKGWGQVAVNPGELPSWLRTMLLLMA